MSESDEERPSNGRRIKRELALVVVCATAKERKHVMSLLGTSRIASVAHVNLEILVVQIAGKTGEIDAFLKLLESFGIKEIQRTEPITIVP